MREVPPELEAFAGAPGWMYWKCVESVNDVTKKHPPGFTVAVLKLASVTPAMTTQEPSLIFESATDSTTVTVLSPPARARERVLIALVAGVEPPAPPQAAPLLEKLLPSHVLPSDD